MIIWQPTESDLIVIERLGFNGIYHPKEVAVVLGISEQDIQNYCTLCLAESKRNEVVYRLGKGKTAAKEELLARMREMAMNGEDRGFAACRYLLQANHGLNDSKAITKAQSRDKEKDRKHREKMAMTQGQEQRNEVKIDDLVP